MRANEYQIGGAHYKVDYECWDFIYDIGFGFLDGASVKYLSRWRKKGGLEDLKKALHYIEKLLEQHGVEYEFKDPEECTLRFVKAHGLGEVEAQIIRCLCKITTQDVLTARNLLVNYIDSLKVGDVDPASLEPKPVPLTEENHYTERMFEEDLVAATEKDETGW